jgi:hypothetical protein
MKPESKEARERQLSSPKTITNSTPLNTTAPKEGKGAKPIRVKFPSVSWSIKEKMDLVTAICADKRFSHGEVRAAVAMIIYFHNTQSGALFPSRAQVAEQACVGKDVVINATRKMRRFDYLHYEQSHGGRNERNTYHLRKRSENPTVLKTETVVKSDTGGRKIRHARVVKSDSHIPLESTLRGKALPSPRKGEAAALRSKTTESEQAESQKATKEEQTPEDRAEVGARMLAYVNQLKQAR